MDARTGALLWSEPLGTIVGAPAYGGGDVYVSVMVQASGSTFARVIAFSGLTGAEVWEKDLDQWAVDAPLTYAGGTVYATAGGVGETLYALDGTSGQLAWERVLDAGSRSAPTVSSTMVYLSYPCETWAINRSNGAVAWSDLRGCDGGGGRTAVLDGNELYVGDTGKNDGIILSAASGQQLGTFSTDPWHDPLPAFAGSTGLFVHKGVLSARIDSVPQWQFTGDGQLSSSPIVTGPLVYIGSATGTVFALSLSTGQELWSGAIGDPILNPFAWNNSVVPGFAADAARLYVTASGRVTALAPDPTATGSTMATVGATAVGSLAGSFPANQKSVSTYTLTSPGVITRLSAYLAPTSVSNEQETLEGVIYSDAGGAPGGLIAAGSPIEFQSTSAPGWYDLDFPAAVRLPAGEYWLGVLTGQGDNVAGFRYVAGAPLDWNRNMLVSGPSDPFGPFSTRDQFRSAYAAYLPTGSALPPVNTTPPTVEGTPATGQTLAAAPGSWSPGAGSFVYSWQRCNVSGAACAAIPAATTASYPVQAADAGHTLRAVVIGSSFAGSSPAVASSPTAVVTDPASTFGQTSVGPVASPLVPNEKFVNAYTLPVAGVPSGVSIYLEPTRWMGSEDVRGVLYLDDGGKPGYEWAGTWTETFTNTDPAGWYELPFYDSTVSLPAGRYWIGVATLGTSSIAGIRYTAVKDSRALNANDASGPSNPFGPFTTDSKRVSLYVSYSPQPMPAPRAQHRARGKPPADAGALWYRTAPRPAAPSARRSRRGSTPRSPG